VPRWRTFLQGLAKEASAEAGLMVLLQRCQSFSDGRLAARAAAMAAGAWLLAAPRASRLASMSALVLDAGVQLSK
jgi:predicted hotdog family 3-hydroxylacyl-ACP dehydratase